MPGVDLISLLNFSVASRGMDVDPDFKGTLLPILNCSNGKCWTLQSWLGDVQLRTRHSSALEGPKTCVPSCFRIGLMRVHGLGKMHMNLCTVG